MNYLSHGFIASTRAFNLLTRAFNLQTRAFNPPTRAFNHGTRAFFRPTRRFEYVTRKFEFLTRGFALLTRGFKLVICRFELVTRNLCFTFPLKIEQFISRRLLWKSSYLLLINFPGEKTLQFWNLLTRFWKLISFKCVFKLLFRMVNW